MRNNRLISLILATLAFGTVGRQAAGAAAPPASRPHLVGCWYSLFYENPLMWNTTPRDTLKTPVAGWGEDTLVGTYRSSDKTILRRQILAARKAGIDFFILDMTNQYGNALELRVADSLFTAMRDLPRAERIKIAIALGKEFWGPVSYRFYRWKFPGWKQQYRDQQSAVTAIERRYIKRFPDLYFRWKGKPLIVAFINAGNDFPPRSETSGKPLSLWKFKRATLRNALSWTATFADTASGAQGQESPGMWGWGAKYPQPVHEEAMSLFPGTYNWPMGGGSYRVDRQGGRFYIRSWHRILSHMPELAIITDWNNWNEETAIEGCVGPHEWTDDHGNATYDLYLRITAAYSEIFHGRAPKDVALRERTEEEELHEAQEEKNEGPAEKTSVSRLEAVRRTTDSLTATGKLVIDIPYRRKR